MKNRDKFLSFEISENSILEIHGNKLGYQALLNSLNVLISADSNDHMHLNLDTDSSLLIGENNVKVDSIKFFYWVKDST
jgi:hypothetical protein